MKISFVVAMGKNQVIGHDNKLLWRLPGDLKKFKELTMGHHLIMGRKTFESIGRPLPGRVNIVLSRRAESGKGASSVVFVKTLDEALTVARAAGETEVFVIGGGQIYQEALSVVERIYLTEVDFEGEGDTFFPPFWDMGWEVLTQEDYPKGEGNPYSWTFKILERKY